MRRAALALAGLLIACAPAGGGGAQAPTFAAPSAPTARATPDPIRIERAAYGSLSFTAPSGGPCDVELHAAAGTFGEPPPLRFSVVPDASGRGSLAYPAPPLPPQRAWYGISCGALRATADVDIALRRIDPAGFTVHVFAAEAPAGVRADASLVPLRDASVGYLAAGLPAKWARATRGLGTLTLVSEHADLPVRVIAARETSVHVTATDGSQEIRIYVADPASGPRTVENTQAALLHELGHLWCCSGPGTQDGHWLTAQRDPQLEGVDAYGLMNHPVSCAIFGAVVSCPDHFSRRELEAFGFTAIPAPPPDPCLSQARPLDASLAQQLAGIRALEAQYARGMPPAVYDDYVRRIAEYNAGLSRRRTLPC